MLKKVYYKIWLVHLVNKNSFVSERHSNSPHSSFSPFLLSLFPFFSFSIFLGLILSSCGTTEPPTPSTTDNKEEILSISTVQVDGHAIDLNTKPTDISLSPVVALVFSQDITADALQKSNKVTLKQGTTNVVYTITQGADKKTIIIRPNAALDKSTDYTLTMAKDLSVKIGEKIYKLLANTVLEFTTTAHTNPLTITRENTIGTIPEIAINNGSVGKNQTFDLPNVRDKNNAKITPTVAVSGRNVTASINDEGKLLINYVSAGTETITLTYTSVAGTKIEDTNNDGVDDKVTETSTTKTKTLAVTVTKTPEPLTITRGNTIGTIPEIAINNGSVGGNQTFDLPDVRDKNNVKITPTVAISGRNVTASINDEGKLLINYVSAGTETITLTYTSAAGTKIEDTNNDGIDDKVTETSTTKTKTLAVTVTKTPEPLTITRENTIAEIPKIIIRNGSVGENQTFDLPDIRDKNNVKITPTVAVSGRNVTANVNDEGKLLVNYISAGAGTITITYTSAASTKTEDTNNDGVNDKVTETSTVKTKALAVTVKPLDPLTISRENTIAEIPTITIAVGKAGETKTFNLPTVRDKNNVKITPIIAVSGGNITASINDEGKLLINYVSAGTETITLTYTSAAGTKTEDANNDGVDDNVTETSTTKTKTLTVSIQAAQTLDVTKENTIGTIPNITGPTGYARQEKIVALPVVRDLTNKIITPTISGGSNFAFTALIYIGADIGELYISYASPYAEPGTYTITLTYTSIEETKKEDTNGDGIIDNVTYTSTTKTKDVVVNVIVRPAPLNVEGVNTIQGWNLVNDNKNLNGSRNTFRKTLPQLRDRGNKLIIPTVSRTYGPLGGPVTPVVGNPFVFNIPPNRSAKTGSTTISFTYTTVKGGTIQEDINDDGVPDNVTLTSSETRTYVMTMIYN